MSLSRDPLYAQYASMQPRDYRPMGAGPASGGVVIPRSQTAIDARTLGFICPTATIDMHVARREGEPEDTPTRGARERATKEKVF